MCQTAAVQNQCEHSRPTGKQGKRKKAGGVAWHPPCTHHFGHGCLPLNCVSTSSLSSCRPSCSEGSCQPGRRAAKPLPPPSAALVPASSVDGLLSCSLSAAALHSCRCSCRCCGCGCSPCASCMSFDDVRSRLHRWVAVYNRQSTAPQRQRNSFGTTWQSCLKCGPAVYTYVYMQQPSQSSPERHAAHTRLPSWLQRLD